VSGGPAATLSSGARPDVLVVGDPGSVARALLERLLRLGLTARQLANPSDKELIDELEAGVGAVAVVTRDDALALRLTLLAAHVGPDVPLLATLFDATVAEQLRLAVPGVLVVSPSELVAPRLAEACLAPERPRRRRRDGLRGSGPMIVDDALRLLVLSGAGLCTAFLLEALLSGFVLHESWVNAVYSSATTLATVTGSARAAHAPGWYKLVSATGILLSLGLVAVFTAALVRRLSHLRLTTLAGPRAAPRSDHVLIVGLGQIGLRLALNLRAQGVAVLGVERDEAVAGVRLAHQAGLPVVIGSGADAFMLRRVGLRRARAVAAVTSNDLVNVEIGLAARATAPDVAVVLRLGDGDVAAETESLLHLGRIFDAHRLAAESLAEALCDRLRAPGRTTTDPGCA
jgi:Trk K+ transport system NAD-binding subunit